MSATEPIRDKRQLQDLANYFPAQGQYRNYAIMHIYDHSSFEVTRRYLGVAQDDLDRGYLGMELF